VLSFILDDIRTEDVGARSIRKESRCAQATTVLSRSAAHGVESTVRPSLALYNTCEEIDSLVAALLRIQAGRGHRGL